MAKEHLISCCCDLFGYSDTDFDEMNYNEIFDYLTDSQRNELEKFNK